MCAYKSTGDSRALRELLWEFAAITDLIDEVQGTDAFVVDTGLVPHGKLLARACICPGCGVSDALRPLRSSWVLLLIPPILVLVVFRVFSLSGFVDARECQSQIMLVVG